MSKKAEYTKSWKARNREKVNATHHRWLKQHPDYRKNRRAVRIAQLEELKKAPCVDCGGTFPSVAMDFDHVNGEKKMTISRMLRSSDSRWEDILAEVAKCDLVCANCHRVRTAKRGDSRPYQYRGNS